MKLIFVGLHNKPDTNPLCRFTKTGKLLQRVINQLPEVDIEKTNLYDIDHYPSNSGDRHQMSIDWYWRVLPCPDDVIILLGAEVHKFFKYDKCKECSVLKYAHPASMRSHEAMNSYVNKMIIEITSMPA